MSSPSRSSSEIGTVAGSHASTLAVSRFAPAPRDAHAAGTPVVYCHGFGQTRHAWVRTADTLARHGHAGISYDARGHGDSARNPPDLVYTGEQFADDLIIVAGEQSTAPVLVGASMGGLFGMVAEARWPGLFRAMVLVDITPRWESAGLERVLGFMTAFPQGFESLQDAADTIAAYLPHRKSQRTPDQLRDSLRQGQDGRWRWHWDPRLIDELARDSEQHQDLIAEAAGKLTCPVLLISGGRSDLVSAETVDEFLRLVPHARHLQLPDASHMLAGEDNDTFTAHVLQYLAELRSADDGSDEPASFHTPASASGVTA
ncbi:peroxidase [Pseudoxanthomonas dokdonensis]|uniref:Peroxidase n=1 Tax=Pseudoxanthomonas dokdonensis TaxID=344882 RepID=A0A0R0CWU8_9GAMM|nr:peroxidase [Pseudoxanthomonas dokdonensis]